MQERGRTFAPSQALQLVPTRRASPKRKSKGVSIAAQPEASPGEHRGRTEGSRQQPTPREIRRLARRFCPTTFAQPRKIYTQGKTNSELSSARVGSTSPGYLLPAMLWGCAAATRFERPRFRPCGKEKSGSPLSIFKDICIVPLAIAQIFRRLFVDLGGPLTTERATP